MPHGHRLPYAALGRCCIVVAALSASGATVQTTAPLSSSIDDQQQTAKRNSKDGGERANDKPSEDLWHRTLTDPIALYTLLLAIFTAVLSGVAVAQIFLLLRGDKTARIAALAAKEAADTGNKNFVAEHRPWLNVQIGFISPLTFDGDGARLTIEYAIENLGRTPALDIHVSAKMLAPTIQDQNVSDIADPGGPAEEWKTPLGERMRKFADSASQFSIMGVTFKPPLFPRGPRAEGNYGLALSNSEIQAAVADDPHGQFYPRIIVAVAYRAAFDKRRFETVIAKSLYVKDARSDGGVRAFHPKGGDIAAGNMVLKTPIRDVGWAT